VSDEVQQRIAGTKWMPQRAAQRRDAPDEVRDDETARPWQVISVLALL
jgi:hypothetical protein